MSFPQTHWQIFRDRPRLIRATDDSGAVKTSSAIHVTVLGAPTQSVTPSYVYDANQRLCKRIEPETGATLMDYDSANNIAWTATGSTLTTNTCDRSSVPAASKIMRTYDARNRPLTVDIPSVIRGQTTIKSNAQRSETHHKWLIDFDYQK